VDGRVFEIRVEDRTCTTSEGSTSRPVAVFTMSAEVLDQLFLGQLTTAPAIADGSVQVAGDQGALARFQELFPPLDVPAASAR
jgi:putative sterol carrier protein